MKKPSYLRLACLCAFILLSLFLIPQVNAKTLTSYNHQYDLENSDACGVSGWYTYTMIDTTGNWNYFTGKVGTSYSTTPNALYFDFNEDLTQNTYYDVKINATHSNFNQNINLSDVKVTNGSTCGSQDNSNISVVSVTKGATSGLYQTLTIRIYSATSVDYWSIFIENDNSITSGSEFGISTLSIDEVDMDNTDAILNNNNSNTDSIINNQNQNNEELKDTIDKNFNSCRESYNLFPGWIIGTGINSTTGVIITSSGSASSTDYIKVDFNSNTYYTLTGLTSNLRTFVAAYNSNKEFLGRTGSNYTSSITIDNTSFVGGTPQGTGSIAYIRITTYSAREGDITQVNDLKTMLNTGNTALDYEEFGKEVCTNNLEEQVKTSKGILGTLKSVFTSIVELPKKIVDLLVDGLKSLFVPDSDELNTLIDDFKSTMSEKLGVIYQSGDLIVGIFQNIIDDTTPENACLTFPELKVPNVDQPIIEETNFCFNEITDEMPILLITIRGITGILITIAFINMLKRKYDTFINGGNL